MSNVDLNAVFTLILVLLLFGVIVYYSRQEKQSYKKSSIKKFSMRRSLFGFTNIAITKSLSIMVMLIVYFVLTDLELRSTGAIGYAEFIEFLISLIGFIYALSNIVRSEKEIKKITGHYYLVPPSWVYD